MHLALQRRWYGLRLQRLPRRRLLLLGVATCEGPVVQVGLDGANGEGATQRKTHSLPAHTMSEEGPS